MCMSSLYFRCFQNSRSSSIGIVLGALSTLIFDWPLEAIDYLGKLKA